MPKYTLNDLINFSDETYINDFSFFMFRSCIIIVPALFLGYFTDLLVKFILNLLLKIGLKDYYFVIALIQIFMILVVFYLLNLFLSKSLTEQFHASFAGVFFVILFIGMQSNLFNNIKKGFNLDIGEHFNLPKI